MYSTLCSFINCSMSIVQLRMIFISFVALFSSCNMKLNLDYLLEKLWEYLALIRVYTKKRGGKTSVLRLYVVKWSVFLRGGVFRKSFFIRYFGRTLLKFLRFDTRGYRINFVTLCVFFQSPQILKVALFYGEALR